MTCLETIYKDIEQDQAISQLVVGAESGQVFILDPSGSQILKTFSLPSAPVHMAVQGVLDVEYRICVACRNGNVYTIKV